MFTAGCRRALRRLRAPDEDGFSLIEVIIAIFVVSVGMLALASTALTAIQSSRISRERQDATQLASRIIEETRSHAFTNIAIDSSTYSGPGVYGAENVHAAAGGPVPHEVSEPPLVANTWVTYVPGTDEKEKRVTTVVSWEDRGQLREVRQSTLITNARRGLPVPNFQVTPDVSSTNAVSGEVVCFDHTLTNLGERDSYSWQLLRPDAVTGDLTPAVFQIRDVEQDGSTVSVQGYNIPDNSGPGKGWFAWARIGDDASSLLPMVDATSDSRPDSPNPVERRGEAIVRVCYTPNHPSGGLRSNIDTAPYLTVRLFSAFDETITRDVDDSLTVISNDYDLYLHSEYKGNSGTPEAADKHLYNLLMDRSDPLNAPGAIDYDGAGTDGLQLPSTGARFRFQNNGSPRTVTAGNSDLSVSVASDSSLVGPPAGDLTIRATVFHETGPGTAIELGTADFSVIPNAAAWTLLEGVIPVDTAVLDDSDYLRLDLSCASTAVEACHVHYDVDPTHRSHLTVTVQS